MPWSVACNPFSGLINKVTGTAPVAFGLKQSAEVPHERAGDNRAWQHR
jgi:hypothetical protein